MDMEIDEAIRIVHDMASQNVIDEREAQADPSLVETRRKQEAALDCVSKWARHALGVRL